MEYIPDSNTKDKVVPEEVQKLEKENRDKNLVFHPPDHPYSVFRRPSLGGLTAERSV
jgi:hypothetical protein